MPGPSCQSPGSHHIPSAHKEQRKGLLQLLPPGLVLELGPELGLELELELGLEPELELGPVPGLEILLPWLCSSYLCTAGAPAALQQRQPPHWEGSQAAWLRKVRGLQLRQRVGKPAVVADREQRSTARRGPGGSVRGNLPWLGRRGRESWGREGRET